MPLNDHRDLLGAQDRARKRILLVVHTNTFFVEPFRLAKYLVSSQLYYPIVFFVSPYPTWLDDASKCISSKIHCIDPWGLDVMSLGEGKFTPSGMPRDSNRRSTLSRLRSAFRKLGSLLATPIKRHWMIPSLMREFSYFGSRFRAVEKLMRHRSPSLLVLGGDMVGYDTAVFVKVAHKRNIPVVIVPSTMSNGLEQAEAYYYDANFGLQSKISQLAARIYPRWVLEHRGKKLLRVPGERVLVMEWLGLAPPLPWIFNSSFADAIATESEQMKQYYLECGIPERQLRLVGSLAYDYIYGVLQHRARNRKALCHELGLDSSKPILLSALPPDSLYMTGGRPECDFRTYRDLVEFWVQSIGEIRQYNVIVCLHPSVRHEEFKYIEKFGARIAMKDTAELVPLCDIYVASVSSTIRWALACGIPVINYDVYRYHYTDYQSAGGVVTVEEQQDYKAVLRKTSTDSEFYEVLASAAEDGAEYWGRLDGKAGERLEQLFASTIQLYSEETPSL